jgi:hypothetical protein
MHHFPNQIKQLYYKALITVPSLCTKESLNEEQQRKKSCSINVVDITFLNNYIVTTKSTFFVAQLFPLPAVAGQLALFELLSKTPAGKQQSSLD